MKLLFKRITNLICIFTFCVFIANIFADIEIPLPNGASLIKENDLGTKLATGQG